MARQSQVCEQMLAGGATEEDVVVGATVSQLPADSAVARRALEIRAQLGIASGRTRPRSCCPTANR